MNYFKSFLLTAFALFTLAACNTDDLRDDVDNLKGRVESLEAQINLLNDNMTAIKRLLEGGQTITEITQTNGTYTLKLSGGETVTLTQGSAGEIKYPEISVNDEGQWVVNGEVLTQNGVPVQAVGTPGNDGITPKFRLTDDGSYWQVSYDNGTSWQDVLDESGNKVSAVNNGSSGGGSSDTFFESAGIDESGDFFVIQLKGQNESISIPIVKDLLCEIIEPAEGMNKGYWEIGTGATATTTVKVKGDNIIVTAPAGWVATVSEPDTETNEATLSITAPASTIKTRATADNSSDVTLQVNKGANWAVAKIQVKAIEIIDSYYALYEAGETIEVGDITIDKATFNEATLIEQEQEISADGVYFIKPEVNVTITTNNFNKLVIISDSPSAKVSVSNTKPFNFSGTDANFIAKNIIFTTANNPFMQIPAEVKVKNIVLDNSNIKIAETRNFLNAHNGDDNSIEHIALIGNAIAFPVTADWKASRILNFQNKSVSASITIRNNVFYTSDKQYTLNGTILFLGNADATAGTFSGKLEISHNTFINFIANSQSIVRGKITGEVSFSNLLFWNNPVNDRTATLINTHQGVPSLTFETLINYIANDKKVTYSYFAGSVPTGYSNSQISLATSNPFEGGTFDIANGVFIPNAEFAEYGASIN